MEEPRYFRVEGRLSGAYISRLETVDEQRRPLKWSDESSRARPLKCLARVDFPKRRWGDAVYVGTADERVLVVSQRVLDVLRELNIQSFHACPIELKANQQSHLRCVPQYAALFPSVGLHTENLSMDRTAAANAVPRIRKMIPLDNTFAGYDLFRDEQGMVCCCTRRVIELAREHAWTNFSFAPLDIDLPVRWNINYLGKPWPPKHWYPPSPSAGQSSQEWIDRWMSLHRRAPSDVTPKEWTKVREAIDELRNEAVPLFVRILGEGDGHDQLVAANKLVDLARQTRIEQSILEKKVLPVLVADLHRRKANTTAQALIVLASMIAIETEVLELAQRIRGERNVKPAHLHNDDPSGHNFHQSDL